MKWLNACNVQMYNEKEGDNYGVCCVSLEDSNRSSIKHLHPCFVYCATLNSKIMGHSSCALHLWCLSASSEVSPHQQQSRWGPPLPRQSRATSHMFLTHCPVLHHVLIIATTRDVTLERQQAAALRGWSKNCTTLHQDFLFQKTLGVSKMWKSSWRTFWKNVTCQTFLTSVVAFVLFSPKYWSPLFCWLESSSCIIGLSAESSCDEWKCSGTPTLGDRLSCGPVH